MELHEVVPVGLDHNTGKCWVGEAICDGFYGERHAVCCCHAWTQSLRAVSLEKITTFR